MQDQQRDTALTARPHLPIRENSLVEPGIYPLALGDQLRDGRLYVPRDLGREPSPLVVLLHGAGADASSMLRLTGKAATAHGCVLLAPDARAHTWDFLVGGVGPDVAFLDRALKQTFERCRIDASRVAIAGFSDGGSYALTLGLANGDLFTHVIAFSPGFMWPPRQVGLPRVFISHGTEDAVLPIARCSRLIVPELEHERYDVTYREFAGPHTVPDAILSEVMLWFLQAPSRE